MQVRRVVTVCAVAVALLAGVLSSEAVAAPSGTAKTHSASHKKHAAKHKHHKHHQSSTKSKG